MRMLFAKQQWELNPRLTANLILTGVWWNIKSVFFEELIFRGVLFYILIKKLGPVKAIIMSAVAFGIYYWFSHGVIGNPVPMAITFVITGTMGLVYAYTRGAGWVFYIFLYNISANAWCIAHKLLYVETTGTGNAKCIN